MKSSMDYFEMHILNSSPDTNMQADYAFNCWSVFCSSEWQARLCQTDSAVILQVTSMKLYGSNVASHILTHMLFAPQKTVRILSLLGLSHLAFRDTICSKSCYSYLLVVLTWQMTRDCWHFFSLAHLHYQQLNAQMSKSWWVCCTSLSQIWHCDESDLSGHFPLSS